MSKPIDILVIDDEQVVRDAVSRVCGSVGLSVETAFDARTGLKMVQSGEYRLVLCDIMLPELDAFHVLEAMQNAGIRTPVIIITGYSTVENAVHSLKSGAVDFIPKPFTADELESAIRRGLRYFEFAPAESPHDVSGTPAIPAHRPTAASSFRLGYLSWAVIEPTGTGLIGMTDVYMKTVSPMKEVKFFALDEDLVQGSVCAKIVSIDKLVYDLLSPLSGRIVERNDAVLSSVETLRKDPYGSGWLYRVIPKDTAYELVRLTPF